MYQFLGRDTLALRCSAQESLFIRKVFRKRDFLWCEINFTNPVGLAENHICDHFLEEFDRDTMEYDWAANVLPLPCDQRYGAEEMQYIADSIREWEETES